MIKGYKPMLATDWYEDKVKFPCIVQVKIDGVHSVNQDGLMLSRRLRAHDNKFTDSKFARSFLHGICGELTLGSDPTLPDLCNLTSGSLRTIEGEPDIHWWVFDYCTEDTYKLGYSKRMQIFQDSVLYGIPKEFNLHLIESKIVYTMEELLAFEEKALQDGYEGIMIRDPFAPYKFGRCGKTFMGVWRVKRFIDAEFRIEEIIEGRTNQNKAEVNALGLTERSTHKENMLPNAMVGTLRGKLLKDVLDPTTKEVILKEGLTVDVSPGKMTEEERKKVFQNQSLFLGKIGKFKLFPKGTKDKPRFGQFQCLRNENDI